MAASPIKRADLSWGLWLPSGLAVDGNGRIYVKRDDLSGPLYGGNKVRKLEHLCDRPSPR